MKNVGAAPEAADATTDPLGSDVAAQPTVQHADGRTRHAVAQLLLERGPVTAAAVADVLGLSPAAVRRHLDALINDGEVDVRDAPRRGHRSRGRPAKLFLLTEAGRARFGHTYDALAVSALRFLAEHGGEQALQEFARNRVEGMIGRHRGTVTAKTTTAARAQALADALTREGYAASTRHVGSGEQLCQHHCPVANVAAEFPQLCEAETVAFADLLGTHVQRLATIARGDAACTTHVPTPVSGAQPVADTTNNRPDSSIPNTSHPDGERARQPDHPAAGRTERIPAPDPRAGSSTQHGGETA